MDIWGLICTAIFYVDMRVEATDIVQVAASTAVAALCLHTYSRLSTMHCNDMRHPGQELIMSPQKTKVDTYPVANSTVLKKIKKMIT